MSCHEKSCHEKSMSRNVRHEMSRHEKSCHEKSVSRLLDPSRRYMKTSTEKISPPFSPLIMVY